MKRETFFDSLNDVDDKYVKSAMRRFSAGQGGETSRKIGKAVYVIVSAAALIAVILAIWIPSRLFRDKPVEPSVSDTDTAVSTDAVTSDEIQTNEPVTETETASETDSSAVTDAATEDEETAARHIDELVEKLVSLKDIEENWEKLRSYGLTAFDALTANYHLWYWKNGEERQIASIYAAETLRDEIQQSDFLRSVTSDLPLPDHSHIGRNDSSADWLVNYRNAILTDAAQKSEAEYEELYPLTYRYLKNTGFYSLDKMMQFWFSEYLIKLYYRNDQDVFEYLIRDRAEDTVWYCTEWYFDKKFEYLSDLENRLVYMVTVNELKDLCGEKAVRLAFGLPDVDFDILSPVLEMNEEARKRYIPTAVELAKEAAKDIYARDMADNYPYVYEMLCSVDFRGYKPINTADPGKDWAGSAAKKGFDKCVAATSVDYIGNILRDLCNQTRIDESADYCLHVYYGDYEPRRKALASWLFTYIVGEHEQNDAYRDLMYITDLNASDEELITLLPACAERAQAKAKNYTRDEISEYFPYTYKLLEKIGFDGYESEPDIASRAKDALIA
ncbi:MAG: hypothetical protein II135_00785, partial [Clostridia bacterium]|nr:hypothetical protein [Clostridia bacterium]